MAVFPSVGNFLMLAAPKKWASHYEWPDVMRHGSDSLISFRCHTSAFL